MKNSEFSWVDFEWNFQRVHHEYYFRLTQRFPGLTVNERRLCCFLRMNMTTEEIHAITGQSPHSIRIARTRLRKKLKLTHTETGLTEFISML